jgi:surfeit locus 1 family protein
VTIALLVLLVCLGQWQLHRAHEQQHLFDEFAAGKDSTRTLDDKTPPLQRFQHVEARGRYDGAHQILIDNMVSDDGRAGYYVVTPFALSGGGWLLVNRGWIGTGASRAVRPEVGVSERERTLHGRVDHLPSPGIRMGQPAPLEPPYPVVATFPSFRELAALLQQRAWTPAAELVLLDAGEADGYRRVWAPPGFPPIRHLAYAVQWFALAAALTVIYVVTNVKRR